MRFPILQAILINSEQFIVRREKLKKVKRNVDQNCLKNRKTHGSLITVHDDPAYW